MADMTPEEALAAQKAQCPFCKIVAGEIPSKRVYEDDQMLAILDINPANKGHLLVMPKEHYYILPLVPPETFKHLFLQSQKLMRAMRKGLIVPRVTLFVANGAAAGQQSPHFLFHLIPREGEGKLDQLDVVNRTVQQQNTQAIAQNTQAIMRNLPYKPAAQPSASSKPTPFPDMDAPPEPPVRSTQAEIPTITPEPIEEPQNPQEKLVALLEMLQQEPALHDMLLQDPGKIEEYARTNPLLHKAFEGINLQELANMLRERQQQHDTTEKKELQQSQNPPITPSQQAQQPQPSVEQPSVDEVPHATDLSDEELRAYVETKPELQRLLAEDIVTLQKMTKSNARLKQFFKKTSPEEVATRIEQDTPIDFNTLAKHLQ